MKPRERESGTRSQFSLRSLLRLAGLALVVCLALYSTAWAQFPFTPIVTGDPVDDGGVSAGVAWGDYNNDGNYDLFVTNWQTDNNFLYMNDGPLVYSFIREFSGDIVNEGASSPFSSGACWGDYNNDGWLDMFVANQQGQNNFLYRNNGDNTFTKVAGQDIVANAGASFTSAWGDYDNDGYLDLYVANIGANFLYHNNGDLTFTRITTGAIVTDVGQSFGASWGDYNNDGYLDLFVANRNNENNFLYRNDGGVSFTRIIDGPVVNDGIWSHGGSWADYDNDGDLDLFVANGVFGTDKLYRNNGDGTFAEVAGTPVSNDASDGWNGTWGDYDNDGDLDLFVTNFAQPNFLYDNNGDGTFIQVISQITGMLGNGSGNAAADYDNDGDLDLFVANWGGQNNYLFRNNATGNNWLGIRCVGVVSNSVGVGARVRVKATVGGTPTWQMREIRTNHGHRSQNPTVADFGLGDATLIDSVIVSWPSGMADTVINVVPNQRYTVVEGAGLICSEPDSDADGIPDVAGACPGDNCPTTFNPSQADSDNDGAGDKCDVCPNDEFDDVDGDGVCGDIDNCPTLSNPDQADADGDGIGNACDCSCPCHTDPECDGSTSVLDVVRTVNIAFRNDPTTADPDCPSDQTDVNCDGVTSVIDVVKVVNVAFRNENPALQFCDPCGP